MKFTDEEMDLIHKNLRMGKCPNCGSDEQKHVFPEEINLSEPDEEEYNAILAQCPHCGFLLFFSKEFILNKESVEA